MIKIIALVTLLFCSLSLLAQNKIYDSLFYQTMQKYASDTVLLAKVRTEKFEGYKAAQEMIENHKFGYFITGHDGNVFNHFLLQYLLLKKFNLYTEFTGCTSTRFVDAFNQITNHFIKQDFYLMRTIVENLASSNDVYASLIAVNFKLPKKEKIVITDTIAKKRDFLSNILNEKLESELKRLKIPRTESDVCFFIFKVDNTGYIDARELFYFGENKDFFSAVQTVCGGLSKLKFTDSHFERFLYGEKYVCIKFHDENINERQFAQIFSPLKVLNQKTVYERINLEDEPWFDLFEEEEEEEEKK